jgi:nucleotide-binding universal stress UspA family protein
MVMGRLERAALQVAAALASEHKGQVDVLVGFSAVSPLAAGWEYVPASPHDTVSGAAKEAAEAMAEDVLEILAEAPPTVRLASSFWLTPYEQTLAEGARATDLVVLGRRAYAIDTDDRLFASTLLGAGRPVMVVPDAAAGQDGFRRIAIAWRPTPEANRALNDAIPLLQRAASVEIVYLPGTPANMDIAEAGDALLAHLDRHGVQAQLHRPPGMSASKGERILEFAQEMDADLVVAGGYGHSKMLEQVLGGVTRTLLRRSSVPVFFSH